MQYRVTIRNDHVIFVVDPETMDVEVAEQIADAIEQRAKDLRAGKSPVLILVDARPLKHDDAQARGVMLRRTTEMDFDRMAVFGVKALQRKAFDLMVVADAHLTRKLPLPLSKIKLFNKQETAEQWLKDFPA